MYSLDRAYSNDICKSYLLLLRQIIWLFSRKMSTQYDAYYLTPVDEFVSRGKII